MNKILLGDCLESLKALPSESVDAIVTDPPYELGFMGKKWDASGIAYNVELWAECLRVLKSGGHLLAFSGTRTYHRMAVAIEDAGFEVRDMLEWVYASGFPKSLNVGKAVDKLQGNEREYVETKKKLHISTSNTNEGWKRPSHYNDDGTHKTEMIVTKGSSPYEGFGTALKPAHEPICMARKPLSEKTIVENVLKHGTGAIDIDGCRIPTSEQVEQGRKGRKAPQFSGTYNNGEIYEGHNTKNGITEGRFPANILCTDDALGEDKSRYFDIDVWAEKHGILQFPKASKAERNKGCEGLEAKFTKTMNDGIGEREHNKNEPAAYNKNHHPTVKPVHLIAWLIRLVSKEGDIVLDPFGGSGTTGVACNMLNRKFILMEQSEEYVEIIKSRTNTQPTLFNQ